MFSRCPSAPAATSCWLVVACVLVLLASPPAAHAKRFDCQMFCRTTGFSGMVGGCRCSFTLFTAKRAVRDHNSVPNSPDTYYDPALLQDARDYTLTDLLRLARDTHHEAPAYAPASTLLASPLPPKHHPAHLLTRPPTPKPQDGSSTPRLSVSSKRKEFEQDLDNGDTSDFLRLPY